MAHQRIKQENERRNVFLRYLGEVAKAVSEINETNRDDLYQRLVRVAKSKTGEADTKMDDRGRRVEEEDEERFGDNVLIVDPADPEEELLARAREGDAQGRLF